MALLELKNVIYNPQNIEVLKNISLEIQPGTVTAFLGSPGSGKSTALKMIAGLLIPNKGNVLFNNKNVLNMNRIENVEYRKHCGFMFQDSALFANQDIYHNFLLPLQIHYPKMTEKEQKQKIEEIKSLVGYTKPLNLRPAGLSIGECKRVAFGRAIICNPEVIFLDEPTESLDDESAKIITNLLLEFSKKGKTIVFVSHDIDFVNQFKCDKYYFENGTIVDKILLEENNLWGEEEI